MSDAEIDILVRRLADELDARIKPKNGTAALAEKLRLNIGTAIVVIGAVCSAVIWGLTELHSVKSAISESGRDKWRRTHQRVWSEQLKHANTNLFVPDPESVVEMIRRFESEQEPR